MRVADISMIVPSPRDVWDLPTLSAPEPLGPPADVLAAMHVYDEHVTPSTITNLPPAKTTARTVRDVASYQVQVGRFRTERIFVHACDGPCDPN